MITAKFEYFFSYRP